MVVLVQEVIEPGLLLQEVVRSWLGSLLFQGQVHALMTPILLRVTRLDAFDAKPEPVFVNKVVLNTRKAR